MVVHSCSADDRYIDFLSYYQGKDETGAQCCGKRVLKLKTTDGFEVACFLDSFSCAYWHRSVQQNHSATDLAVHCQTIKARLQRQVEPLIRRQVRHCNLLHNRSHDPHHRSHDVPKHLHPSPGPHLRAKSHVLRGRLTDPSDLMDPPVQYLQKLPEGKGLWHVDAAIGC